ncbi:hypothetical protein BH18ACI2_BH18ACI2_28050 [soil metagenome]
MLQSLNQRGRFTKMPALALLCLLAHAFFVSATHYHRSSLDLSSSSSPRTSVSEQKNDDSASNVAGHSQCLLCRLQRSFTTDLQESILSVAEPQAATIASQNFYAAFYAGRNSTIRRGRAPPLA